MGTLIRWLTLIAIAVFAYMIFTQARSPEESGQSGLRRLLTTLRQVGRKARLVALIYVLTIVISAALRVIFGWGV